MEDPFQVRRLDLIPALLADVFGRIGGNVHFIKAARTFTANHPGK